MVKCRSSEQMLVAARRDLPNICTAFFQADDGKIGRGALAVFICASPRSEGRQWFRFGMCLGSGRAPWCPWA
jgi:hypothetical protein